MTTPFAGRSLRQFAVIAVAIAGLCGDAGRARADDLGQLTRRIETLKKVGKLTEAVAAAKRRAQLTEKRSGAGSAQTAAALEGYADLLIGQNRLADALPIVRRVLAIRDRVLGEQHERTTYSLLQLAFLLDTTGAHAESEPHLRRALRLHEQVFGNGHAMTATVAYRLGANLYMQSKNAEAETVLRQAADMRRSILGPNHADTADSLQWLGDAQSAQNRYTDAIATYEQALTIREAALGPGHLDTALTLHNLGWANMQSAKAAAAIPLLERAAAIREKVLGLYHAHTALTLQLVATSSFIVGRFDQGAIAADRALAVRRKILAPDDLDLIVPLNMRAMFHQVKGEFAEAEKLLLNALAIQEKRFGPGDPRSSDTLELLGYLNEFQARYATALELFQRGAATRARFGREDVAALRLLENAARVQENLGRYEEAEHSYRTVLTIREKISGPDSPDSTSALIGLADGYARQGRSSEAESLYRRTLEIREKAYGPDHFLVAGSLTRLGRQLRYQGRYDEAAVVVRRAVELDEKIFGRSHFFTAVAMEDLADLYDRQGQLAEAELWYRRAIEIEEKTLGPKHANVAGSVSSLAALLWKLGRADEAEAARARQLAINLEVRGPDHDNTASAYGSLGWIQVARGRWDEALSNYSLSSEIYARRNRSFLPSLSYTAPLSQESEIGRNAWTFLNHLRVEYWAPLTRAGGSRIHDERAAADRTFELVQWARLSDTSAALAQMSLRKLSGNDSLAALVREYQDLAGEWRIADPQRVGLVSKDSGARQGPSAASAAKRLADIEARLAEIGGELQRGFPDYAELSRPQPVPARELQQLLGPDEAFVHFSLTPMDCFVWIVTRDDLRWVRLATEQQALVDMVGTLRQQLASGEFDLNLAHRLYQAIFAPIEQQLAGKHLLIVPSGALTSLPLHLLVTQPPEASDEDALSRYRKAAWLAKRQPITILPSVSALRALRHRARPSGAPRPYLGLGNPLVTGFEGNDRRAWEIKGCPPLQPPAPFLVAAAGAPGPQGLSNFFRGNAGNLAVVRRLEPIPETAAELCAVAASLGSGADALLLGADATEEKVKRLSQDGALAATRVLHFATHGLVAGEVEGLAEPALVMTPPAQDRDDVSSDDDGLLTASEIAQLKLDADWVVLSACNTASGNTLGAEALSGLARAFFYAGARALLVSHWAVNSEAAVKLTIGAFTAMADDRAIGRAEALRRAMTKLIDDGELYEAHPAYWAPFVVVGEGSARQ